MLDTHEGIAAAARLRHETVGIQQCCFAAGLAKALTEPFRFGDGNVHALVLDFRTSLKESDVIVVEVFDFVVLVEAHLHFVFGS